MRTVKHAFRTTGLLHALCAFRCALAARARSCSTRRRKVVEGRKLELGCWKTEAPPCRSHLASGYIKICVLQDGDVSAKKDVEIK